MRKHLYDPKSFSFLRLFDLSHQYSILIDSILAEFINQVDTKALLEVNTQTQVVKGRKLFNSPPKISQQENILDQLMFSTKKKKPNEPRVIGPSQQQMLGNVRVMLPVKRKPDR